MSLSDSTFQVFDVATKWIFKKEKRLDASFYAKDVVASRLLIEELKKRGIKVNILDDLSEKIFWPGRFKRVYVSKNEGDPFLMPSEVFMFLPQPEKFIVKYPESLSINTNWLLITRSGNVGRCLIGTGLLEKFVLSDDLIRVIPNNEKVGYIYAFLNTWIGQSFLIKDQYGATVKHIEPHHVAEIPIPIIPKLDDEVNKQILKAHKLKEEAQNLLLNAQEMLYSLLELPKIDENDVEFVGDAKGQFVKAFEIKKNDLDLRLDASYHLPIIRKIKSYLSNSKYPLDKLGNLIDSIFVPTRFKRPYVKEIKEGIPFLQGSHIPQIRPLDVKLIWSKMKNIEKILLKKNWILMTRSGTVGRVGIVSDAIDGWGASEHVLRIILKKKFNPGFVIAFLGSSYGELQIKGKVYGAVVDEIAERDTSLIEDIDIPVPDKEIQDKIGELVLEAYNKKDEANQIEDNAIKTIENALLNITKETTI